MTVAQLIAALGRLPQDARVERLYDGFCTNEVDVAYLARGTTDDGCQRVIILPGEQYVYNDEDRPSGAPSAEQQSHWEAREHVA